MVVMIKEKLNLLFLFLVCLTIICVFPRYADGRALESTWTLPQPLNATCCASWPRPVVDSWGHLHFFWNDNREFITYTFLKSDGSGWSDPIEILSLVTGRAIGQFDVVVDNRGILHLAWIESGTFGPMYYSSASVWGASSARAWSEPILLADQAFGVSIINDSLGGTVHIVYTPFQEGTGFVHISTTNGEAWTEPHEAVSMLGSGWAGGYLIEMAIDSENNLHVFWNSAAYPEGFPPQEVFYQRSVDGGLHWSEPYDPDPLPPDVALDRISAFKNTNPYIAISPEGDVHLTWHCYTGARRHTWSTNGGENWIAVDDIYPQMGAAYNGVVGMAFDSLGRMHTIATRGTVWYQSWDRNSGWGQAELVDTHYANWHHQQVAIVGGRHLHLFYADINETGIIWTTSQELINAPAYSSAPPPTATATATAPPPTPTRIPDIPVLSVTPGEINVEVTTEGSLLGAIGIGSGLSALLVLGVLLHSLKLKQRSG